MSVASANETIQYLLSMGMFRGPTMDDLAGPDREELIRFGSAFRLVKAGQMSLIDSQRPASDHELMLEKRGVLVVRRGERPGSGFATQLRLLLREAVVLDPSDEVPATYQYVDQSIVVTCHPQLATLAERQREVSMRLESSSDFVHSASYLGSKWTLRAGIVAAIEAHVDDDCSILDLMCGSGAVAGAMATKWRTFASDAQEFALCLAKAQGGFPGTKLASSLAIQTTLESARAICDDRMFDYSSVVGQEEEMLLFTADGSLGTAFDEMRSEWLRTSKRIAHSTEPITANYATIYFGVRQAIELDALRNAIAAQPDVGIRRWLNGALVATTSAVATTFGGHFAQPPKFVRSTDRTLRRFVRRRQRSVLHEFEKRAVELAAIGGRDAVPLSILEGPYPRALAAYRRVPGQRKAVYIDAPYTRDEYSRYYHVLETLCLTGQPPQMLGEARIPPKGEGGRFKSGFHTRSARQMTARLQEVLTDSLDAGFTVFWSYADTAAVSIDEVLQGLRHTASATYNFPASHAVHGAHPTRRAVNEHLIVIDPSTS